MARDGAWLEKRRGDYVIRYKDPVLRTADGAPRVGIAYPKDRLGRAIRTKTEARAALDAYMVGYTRPPRANASKGSVPIVQPMTILQLALRWYQSNPKHKTRPKYMSAIQRLIGPDHLNVTYPGELTAAKVNKYKADRGFVGVHKPCAYLKSVLGWAYGPKGAILDAFDQRLSKALAQPQSQSSNYEVITRDEHAQVLDIARRWGPSHHAMTACISLYGWRGATACQLKVGDVSGLLTRQPAMTLSHLKDTTQEKDRRPFKHPLLPESVELLIPIVEGRGPDEFLFLHGGEPWHLSPTGDADQYNDWYNRCCKRVVHPTKGTANALRRFAIWRMTEGEAPWAHRMNNKQIATFTGHRDLSVIDKNYRATSMHDLREAAGLEPIVSAEESEDDPVVIEMDALHRTLVRMVVVGGGNARQGTAIPDETVSYGVK